MTFDLILFYLILFYFKMLFDFDAKS